MTPKVTQPRCLHFIEIFSLVKIFLGSRKYFTMTKLIQMTLLFVSNCSRYWVLIYLLFSFQSPHWFVCLLRIIETKYLWKTVEKGRGLFGLTTNAIEFEKKSKWCQLGLIICYTLFTTRQSQTFPELCPLSFLFSSFTEIPINMRKEILKQHNVFDKDYLWVLYYQVLQYKC